MLKSTLTVDNIPLPLITLDAAVIGSGCAGFNAADWLYDLGRHDVAIITEGVNMGTSRNTGSDKQTYYKLSLAADEPDSVADMAQDLFSGGGVDGDTAYSEAANSVRGFIKLANLGVPFPTNLYGEYAGYKTDHDPRCRATSAGPLTSKFMTEALENSVRGKNIPILDNMTAIQLLTENNKVCGILCCDSSQLDAPHRGLSIIRASNIILATGGPAVCYAASVYPESQTGMTGMALTAGAKAANLQEWQYGLGSIKFRWNVSGTYQQVLPRYISIDKNGVEREFLFDYYDNPYDALNMVFLKGYQWPFDTAKVSGSSMIDILVHHEICDLGRRVYLDFRSEPVGLSDGFDGLCDETREYLSKSGALIPTPIARLAKMNTPAIELYRSNGIDLYKEPLEIAVCAQHHNGGLKVDLNWQTTISGLYAAGEAAGTFGTARPGGSALNSTQAGSLRAAEHITYSTKPDTSVTSEFEHLACSVVRTVLEQAEISAANSVKPDIADTSEILTESQQAMTAVAAHMRNIEGMEQLETKISHILQDFFIRTKTNGFHELPDLYKTRDMLITQSAVLSAMRLSAISDGTKGSALILDKNGACIHDRLPEYRVTPPIVQKENLRVITEQKGNGFISAQEKVNGLPKPDNWFENVWNDYRKRTNK